MQHMRRRRMPLLTAVQEKEMTRYVWMYPLQVLNPKLQIIAPVREWKMTR